MSYSNVKSVVIDIANRWTTAAPDVFGVRRFEFVDDDNMVIPITASDYTAYATTYFDASTIPANAFDTSLLKTNYSSNRCYMTSIGNGTNQRLICVLNTAKSIKGIIVNNHHNNGQDVDYGIKDIKIYFSTDTITNTTYNDSISNGKLVYNGQVAKHTLSTLADDQVLVLIEPWTIDVPESLFSFVSSIDTATTRIDIAEAFFDFEAVCNIRTIPESLFLLESSIENIKSKMPIPEAAFQLSSTVDAIKIKVEIAEAQATLTAECSGYKFFSVTDAFVRYFLVITGTQDTTTDIEIPMSSFQARRRNNEPTYLSVVVPTLDYVDAIAARSNGKIIIYQGYEYEGQILQREKIIETAIERVDDYKGDNNQSLVLTGYTTSTYNPKEIDLTEYAATYRAVTNGKLRYRLAKPYIFLNPGDTVIINDDTFEVGVMSYAISPKQQTIEIEAVA